MTPHADRHADRRAVLPVAGDVGERARSGAIVIDPGWLSRPEYQRVDVPSLGFEAETDSKRAAGVGAGPAANDRDHAVRVVPAHHRVVDLQQLPDFLGDRGEHLLRRRSARDKGRHPAQRRLLLGEPAQFYSRLRVGDCGRDQLGEPGQPDLDVRRQRLVAR